MIYIFTIAQVERTRSRKSRVWFYSLHCMWVCAIIIIIIRYILRVLHIYMNMMRPPQCIKNEIIIFQRKINVYQFWCARQKKSNWVVSLRAVREIKNPFFFLIQRRTVYSLIYLITIHLYKPYTFGGTMKRLYCQYIYIGAFIMSVCVLSWVVELEPRTCSFNFNGTRRVRRNY